MNRKTNPLNPSIMLLSLGPRGSSLRTYQPRSGKPEFYQQFVWTNQNLDDS